VYVAMARLNSQDEKCLQNFADRCGCSLEELQHAITARSANEMDALSFLALRGYISNDVFLKMRSEIV
jgi:hypothetical protein